MQLFRDGCGRRRLERRRAEEGVRMGLRVLRVGLLREAGEEGVRVGLLRDGCGGGG